MSCSRPAPQAGEGPGAEPSRAEPLKGFLLFACHSHASQETCPATGSRRRQRSRRPRERRGTDGGDAAHKVSRRLANDYSAVVFEDLRVPSMVKNHSLASATMDASWGQLRRLAACKAQQGASRSRAWNGSVRRSSLCSSDAGQAGSLRGSRSPGIDSRAAHASTGQKLVIPCVSSARACARLCQDRRHAPG